MSSEVEEQMEEADEEETEDEERRKRAKGDLNEGRNETGGARGRIKGSCLCVSV